MPRPPLSSHYSSKGANLRVSPCPSLSTKAPGLVISIGYGMGDPLARSSPIGKRDHSPVTAEAAVALKKWIPLSEDREQWRGEASPP